jgi:hypothetical protein
MIIRNLQFKIPITEVLLRLKYNVKKSEISPPIQKLLDDMMNEGAILSEPQAIIEDYWIREVKESEVILEGTHLTLIGRSLREHLRDCYKVTVLVSTIGSACETKVKEFLLQKEISKAATLDAVASESVEAFTEAVNLLINQNAMSEGATTVMRFSAGYGDWPIAEQKRIVAALNASEIGVSVNEASLLIPEKSVSACIGWKKGEKPVRKILR